MEKCMIKVYHIVKKYDKYKALNDVSFNIKEGEFFGILGPNGAGKTTFVRILSSLTSATSGSIFVDGELVDRNNSNIKSKIGIVSQHINLEREMNVYDNLVLHARLFGIDKESQGEIILKQLEFADLLDWKDTNVNKLSGGMKRKLMIVRAMLHEPKLLIMDEPTVGLDVSSRRKIWDLLKKLHHSGTTIVLTTHYIEEAESLCDKIAFLNRGRVVALDTPKNLIEISGKYTLEAYNEETENTVTMFFRERVLALEEAKKYNTTVRVRETNLEDTFVNITSERVL